MFMARCRCWYEGFVMDSYNYSGSDWFKKAAQELKEQDRWDMEFISMHDNYNIKESKDTYPKRIFDHVKDSGKRESFDTGSQRDTDENKPKYKLIPLVILERLAQHYSNGSVKYGDRNWQLGQPISRYYDSAMRHMVAFIRNENDEDHIIAAIWNLIAMAWTIYAIENDILYDPDNVLDDRKEML